MTTKLRTIARHTLADAFEASGFHTYELREHYSGRGMEGTDCFGLVVDTDDMPRVYVALGWACGFAEASDGDSYEDDMAMFEGLIRSARSDSMGRHSAVVYFPGWTLED